MTERRGDEPWLAERMLDPATRVVVVWRSQSLVTAGDSPRPLFLPAPRIAPFADALNSLTLLGAIDGTIYFAADLSGDDPVSQYGLEGEFADLRRIGALLEHHHGGLLAYARGMAYWHLRHRFCGQCGAPTIVGEAGHQRRCGNPACEALHFPRTDPAIIVLITDGDRCLLARQASWPAGQYATLAGFVEPGESLEDALAREVMEEVGVEVGSIRYHSSQPWPFPASLMVGFRAEAVTTALRIDPGEIEDARWFSRDELLRAIADGAILFPSRVSVAYTLMRGWLDGNDRPVDRDT